jgi:hypothetical protein
MLHFMLQVLVVKVQDFDKAYEHFMALSNWTMYVADYINHLRTVQPRCLDQHGPAMFQWVVVGILQHFFGRFFWHVDLEDMDEIKNRLDDKIYILHDGRMR